MSFQVDPPLLFLSGLLVGLAGTLGSTLGGRLMDRDWWNRSFFLAGLAVLGSFWLFSFLFYLDEIRIFGLTGPEFMWDWPFHTGITRNPTTDALALFMFGVLYPLSYYIGFELGWVGSSLLKGRARKVTGEVLDELILGSVPVPMSEQEALSAAGRVKKYLAVVPPSFRDAVSILVAGSTGFLAPRFVPGERRFSPWTSHGLVEHFRNFTTTRDPMQRNLATVFKTVAAVGAFTDTPGWNAIGYPGPPPASGIPWHTTAIVSPSSLQEALDAMRAPRA